MNTNTLALSIASVSLALASLATTAEAKPEKPKKHNLSFAEADADASGGLDIFEFATTKGPGVPMVEVRRRFLAIDVSGGFEVVLDPITGEPAVDPITGEPVVGDPIPDGFVTLEEIAAYRDGDKTKPELGRFELADFDGDGVLTLVEFGYLTSPKVPLKNVSRQFKRLDADESGLLTKDEFRKPEVDPA